MLKLIYKDGHFSNTGIEVYAGDGFGVVVHLNSWQGAQNKAFVINNVNVMEILEREASTHPARAWAAVQQIIPSLKPLVVEAKLVGAEAIIEDDIFFYDGFFYRIDEVAE